MEIKKRLGMALGTTALAAALVGGGTFALFTAEAANENNTFASGSVKISMDKPNGTKYFDIKNMAPGDKGSETVTVKNSGTLDLRYDLAQTLTGELAAGANGLKITITDANGNVITPSPDNNRELAAGAEETLTVSYELPLDAGNEYQEKGATLGLKLMAEQTKNNPVK